MSLKSEVAGAQNYSSWREMGGISGSWKHWREMGGGTQFIGPRPEYHNITQSHQIYIITHELLSVQYSYQFALPVRILQERSKEIIIDITYEESIRSEYITYITYILQRKYKIHICSPHIKH
jgi:hypothetical protein